MKGVVLTGGKGSRLRPFTYSGAKQLVPVANVPVLHFPVRQLVACGITEIALVVGDTEGQIREAMGDGGAFGARFTYLRQEAPLGIAHALALAREFAGGEPIILYLGDNVLLHGIETFARGFAESDAAGSVILKRVDDPRAFGVAEMAGGELRRIVEKPLEPPSNFAVIGVYAFQREVFDVIDTLSPSARGELEIADAINGLLTAGRRVEATVTDDYWIDTGKMEDMLAANRAVLETVASETVLPASCEVLQPCAIAPDAVIRDSRIGPYVSIGTGCTIIGSVIENSIVMQDTVIEDSPGIRDSMIGRFAVVRQAPAGARLTLGDHSRFEGPA